MSALRIAAAQALDLIMQPESTLRDSSAAQELHTALNAAALAVEIPRLGAIWPGQGGIYAGMLRGLNGAPDFHLIVPTDPAGAHDAITWGGAGHREADAESDIDGPANTKALTTSAIDHPAAQWAAALTIDGHTDWYLPARHELRLCFLTVPELFETDDYYWTSTQYAGTSYDAWVQDFEDGFQSGNHKTNEYRARAVRRLPI